jgi:5'-nucleotidase
MVDDKPTILITNDDGITSPGIKALVESVIGLGKVVVVAPDSPQSGMGHAITIGTPLRMNKVDIFPGIESWQCSGTPADCVKLANDRILHAKPDICLSGINHGANHSINVIYSGTMSAAMEAAIEGIPSIGFSLLDFKFDADFSVARKVVYDLTVRMLARKMPDHILLNVNIPIGGHDQFKGLKLCRQAYAKWEEEFDHRVDPRGNDYYWMVGKFVNLDKNPGTDVEALKEGYASIVPIRIDFTDVRMLEWLGTEWKDLN